MKLPALASNSTRWAAGLILAAGLLALPWLVGQVGGTAQGYYMRVITLAGVWIMLTLGVNLILGYTGLLTFGHAGFYCIGAYTSALLALRLGWSFWLAMPAAVLVSGVFGLLLGAPTLRVKDDYLAVVTLAFGEIVRLTVLNWVGLTRGPMGLPHIPAPSLFGMEINTLAGYYYLCLGLVVLTVLVTRRLVYSPFGQAMMAVRDNEVAAQAMGVDVTKVKVLVFALGGMYAGLAGSFFAHFNRFISPQNFTSAESITMLLMAVLGGIGSIPGAVIGATSLAILPEALRAIGQWRLVLYGLLMVVVILVLPRGIMGGRPMRLVRSPARAVRTAVGGGKHVS